MGKQFIPDNRPFNTSKYSPKKSQNETFPDRLPSFRPRPDPRRFVPSARGRIPYASRRHDRRFAKRRAFRHQPPIHIQFPSCPRPIPDLHQQRGVSRRHQHRRHLLLRRRQRSSRHRQLQGRRLGLHRRAHRRGRFRRRRPQSEPHRHRRIFFLSLRLSLHYNYHPQRRKRFFSRWWVFVLHLLLLFDDHNFGIRRRGRRHRHSLPRTKD